MNCLSLFTGVGGLDLGIKLACPDARTVCCVELDGYCRRVLAARMADGWLDPCPIWGDVATFDGRPWRGCVDLVFGGFPCTDISLAGKRAGIVDGKQSGLWREYARVVREVGPRFVFVENVAALVSVGLDVVLGDLAALGLDAEWLVLGADDVGAPHRRKRIFILAMANACGQRGPGRRGAVDLAGASGSRQGEGDQWQRDGHAADDSEPAVVNPALDGRREGWPESVADGRRDAVAEPDGELADAAIPRLEGRPGRPGNANRERTTAERDSDVLADADERRGDGLYVGEQSRHMATDIGGGGLGLSSGAPSGETLPLFPPGPADADAWRAILGRYPDLAPAVATEAQSGVRRMADGVASRMDRLKALGNAVVSVQAAMAFRALGRRLDVTL